MTEQEIQHLRNQMRAHVLGALDNFATQDLPMTAHAVGWKDHDLDALFKALDAHFAELVKRYRLDVD
jgi:hypothetical protein